MSVHPHSFVHPWFTVLVVKSDRQLFWETLYLTPWNTHDKNQLRRLRVLLRFNYFDPDTVTRSLDIQKDQDTL